jgi:hypothetical protein
MSDKQKPALGTLTSSDHRRREAVDSQPPRYVRFPAERPIGALWVRNYSLDSHAIWESCGNAQGTITVPGGKELRLNVSLQASTDLSPLSRLQPEDLQYLQLSGTRVTNAGLAHLQRLTGLRVLWLYDTRINDQGLVHLQGLTNLRVLNLRGTLVSPGGVDALQQTLPECEIRRAWKEQTANKVSPK